MDINGRQKNLASRILKIVAMEDEHRTFQYSLFNISRYKSFITSLAFLIGNSILEDIDTEHSEVQNYAGSWNYSNTYLTKFLWIYYEHGAKSFEI